MILLVLGSLAMLAYVYGGYLLMLQLVVAVRGPRPVRKADIRPTISFVISAYNEAAVIRKKLENTLALLYPAERLQIVVVSDASNDGTDDIVREFADRGVTLARQPFRRGKTAGLNAVVDGLSGELVVFSDANAMYDRRALLNLSRNFADAEVGCVTGEARYLPGEGTTADTGERAYWSYEMYVKRLETALGSMVGGDGAIYAIRRALWRPLPENAINDFLNPLQIVAAGWRSVYEPEAVCYEETAGVLRLEYRRRVRIVSRSWRAIFQASAVLNPLRVGLFAWSLWSHKVLRWLSGIFVVTGLVGGAATAGPWLIDRPVVSLILLTVIALTVAAVRPARRLARMLPYFATIYAASLVGVAQGSLGHVSGIWAPPRRPAAPDQTVTGFLVPVGRILQVAAVLVVLGAVLVYRSWPLGDFARLTFWVSSGVLAYIYMGYPALLAVVRRFAGRPVHRETVLPTVCMFITANDEAAVIEAKLRNTLALDYPRERFEVVLASDGSVDDTNTIARRFSRSVRLLEFSPRRGKVTAINEGIRSVSSDVVIFSDANTFLHTDAVRALVRNFADPQVGAVSGDVVLVGDRAALAQSEDLYYRYERWVQRAESEIGSMIGADGALYAIRRELFVPPPADTILDDMAIPFGVIKAGYRVVFEGSARAVEQGSETAKEEFARKARVIAGAMQFVRRRDMAVPLGAAQVILSLVSHKVLRWLSPLFVACAFASSLVLSGTHLGYAGAAAGQLVLLVLGLAGCAPALRRVAPIAIAHYFCLVQAAAAVGFIRGITGRQSVLWRRVERMPRPAPVAYME